MARPANAPPIPLNELSEEPDLYEFKEDIIRVLSQNPNIYKGKKAYVMERTCCVEFKILFKEIGDFFLKLLKSKQLPEFFFQACMEAYLAGDPHIEKLAEKYRMRFNYQVNAHGNKAIRRKYAHFAEKNKLDEEVKKKMFKLFSETLPDL